MKIKKLRENFRPLKRGLKEAHYGGAFDIRDDEFFTRDDINEFMYRLVDELSDNTGYRFEGVSVYMERGNILDITVQEMNTDTEVNVKQKIDLRKIRLMSDFYDKYAPVVKQKILDELGSYLGESVKSPVSKNDSVDLDYDNLYVEFSYIPRGYEYTRSRIEDAFALYGTSYEDAIEYTYSVDARDVKEVLLDCIVAETEEDSSVQIPDKDYIFGLIENYSNAEYGSEDRNYNIMLAYDYIDTHLDELVEVFNKKLLDYFEKAAAEEAANKIYYEINGGEYF